MKNNNAINEKDAMANAILRVVLCCVGLCILMTILFALFKGIIPDKLAEYDKKGNMEHTAWLVKYGSYLPPVIIMVGILTACYPKSCYVPVKTQRNKTIVIGVVSAFIYTVLLPSVKGGDRITYENCVGWFFAQAIPLAIVLSYHLIRASTEKKELEANEK